MSKVALIHWNAAEGRAQAKLVRQAGYQVKLEVPEGHAILKSLRADPPAAVVIDLDRLPMQGRDLGVAIRTGKQTRDVPIIFVAGDPAKVQRVRQMLPDAAYSSWAAIGAALKLVLVKPPVNPIVPNSNLAGYSGTPLPRKLGIKPDFSVALLNEPDHFVELLCDLPPGVRFTHRLLPETQLAIWFVRSSAELASRVDVVAAALGGAHLWVCWPKRTSRLAADVNERAVRTAGLAAALVDYKVAAIDADWSGLLFAPRRPTRPA
ncbi:MAG TPA: hypothetical protein VI455_02905 [Terriglobia bacterium]